MKKIIFNKIATVILYVVSIILSWGGMIYASYDPDQFKAIGVLVSFIGYGLFFWAILRYENDTEEQA